MITAFAKAAEVLEPISSPYQSDPVAFVSEQLGAELWPAQQNILRSVQGNRLTAVKAAHASGKSFVAAAAMRWWLETFPNSIAISTAPTWTQVEKVLWGEIHKQAQSSGFAGELNRTEMRLGPDRYAIGLSTNEGVRFQGFHADNVLIVLDEAPGVRPDIYEAIEGIRAGGRVHILAIGNPTTAGGPFYDAFKSSAWESFTISALDTPNLQGLSLSELLELPEDELDYNPAPYLTTRRWVKEKYHDWGLGDPRWQSRVMGQFPAEDPQSLIPLAWLERAQRTTLEQMHPIEIGVDVADEGADSSVIYVRCGGWVRKWGAWSSPGVMATVGHIARCWRDYGSVAKLVKIDAAPPGVVGRLREVEPLMPTAAVNAGAAARDKKNFVRAKDEHFWHLRELFEHGMIDIDPADDTLVTQLLSMRWEVDSSGRIVIEPKKKMRARGLPSPDHADALMLVYAEHVPGGAGPSYRHYDAPPKPTLNDDWEALHSIS